MTSRPVADLLVILAEPTRLRIVNCLSAAPLFIQDLCAILDLPQSMVRDHVDVLESVGVVRGYEVLPQLLYTLAPLAGARERLLRSVMDAVRGDPAALADRANALARSRSRLESRVGRAAPLVNAS